jgi:hypothetical protein
MATLIHAASAGLQPRDSPGRQSWRQAIPWLLLILLLSVPLAFGAFRAFPLYDDGWVLLRTKEAGAAALFQGIPDRPLLGHLFSFFVGIVSASPVSLVLLSGLIWAVFALEAGFLWRRLFPDLGCYACLVSCLTLAPIVVQVQLCTVMIALPCVLPAALAYGALLLWLRYLDGVGAGLLSLCCAAGLTISGILVSEYAVAASLAGLAILVESAVARSGEERKRALTTVVFSVLATTVAYVAYRRLSSLAYRADVNPLLAAENATHKVAGVVLDLITGVWHSVIGGYGPALHSVALYWDSPSTILGVSFGLVIALVLGLCCGTPRLAASMESEVHGWKRVCVLSAAVAAGLAPVALMGRSTTLTEFGSRFLIPALPVATVLTVLLVVTLFRKRYVWIPITVLGLVCGNAAVVAANTAAHRHRLVTSIGNALQPYASMDSDYTVAISSMSGMDYELTAKATKDWPAALGKKLWIYDYDAGLAVFGPRTDCNPRAELHKSLRLLERNGPISRLLWLETRGEKLISVEPYCRNAAPHQQNP